MLLLLLLLLLLFGYRCVKRSDVHLQTVKFLLLVIMSGHILHITSVRIVSVVHKT